jgi:NitT/TauT family transport system substrate-binding protein
MICTITATSLLLTAALFFTGISPVKAAEPRRVSIGIPSFTNMEELPYHLAEKKGYFKEEGLSPEFILMKSFTIRQAMASESLLYTTAASTGIAAAVSGIDTKILWVASAKTLMFLMAKPDIKSLADLKGKRIGVSGIGSASDIGVRAMLSANGVNPKDMTFLSVGTTDARLVALKAGIVDATPLSPPVNSQAEPLGFKSLGFVGDHMPNAFGGLAIHHVALEKEPNVVHALVRIGLKGLRVMKQNKNFTVKMLESAASIRDSELASRVYDMNVGHFTDDGIVAEKTQQAILEESKRQLKVDKPTPLTIFDFSFAQKVRKELSGWKP